MSTTTRYLAQGRLQQSIHGKVLAPLLMRTGLASTLAVPGRKTGKIQCLPVNVLALNGERYLVSARGDSQWVRNLRAAGGGEIRRHGKVQRFTFEEVAEEWKPTLIAAYRARWDSQVKAYFEQLPDPADHPVFRLIPR